MAGNAVIGALRATLGLDSAQFSTGLNNARGSLGRFGNLASSTFRAVALAGTAAATALGFALKGAIDRADELSKASQKIGVTTEALSRLEWAAKLSDVSLEQLSGGLGKLSKAMLEVSQGGGGAAADAFAALGIKVTDAEGKLRSSDAVFSDIAEAFSRLEDGSTKTALAMQIFGRSGAELIPMLNAGKSGLAEMAAESDRLGNTISTKTGKAAEQFNDTLTRIQAIMGGVVNKIMEAALPALQNLANTLSDPAFAANAAALGNAIIAAMDGIVRAVNAAVGAFQWMGSTIDWLNTHDLFGNKLSSGPRGAFSWLPKKTDPNSVMIENDANLPLTAGMLGGAQWAQGGHDWFKTKSKKPAAPPPVSIDATGIPGLGWGAGKSWGSVFGASVAPPSLSVGDGGSGSGGGGISAAVETAKPALAELRDDMEETANLGKELFGGLGSAIVGAFREGKNVASTVLDFIANKAFDKFGTALDWLVEAAFSFGGGGLRGPNLTSFLPGLGGLPRFAGKGMFNVGGAGGVDSQLVAFRASPDERVSITGQNDSGGAGSGTVTINQSFPITGAVSSRDIQAMVQQGAGQAVEAVKRSLPTWQVQMQRDGAIA